MHAAPGWHISTRSATGACVEVRFETDAVLVRDSKARAAATLRFTPDSFRSFVAAVKAGDFDLRR
jgi:hypothetical protein